MDTVSSATSCISRAGCDRDFGRTSAASARWCSTPASAPRILVIAAHAQGLRLLLLGFITALNFGSRTKNSWQELGAVWPMRIANSRAGLPQGQIDRVVPRERAKVTWK